MTIDINTKNHNNSFEIKEKNEDGHGSLLISGIGMPCSVRE